MSLQTCQCKLQLCRVYVLIHLTCLAALPDQVYAQRQAALHQGQAEQMRHTALNRITPSPSPFLLVPQTLAPQQVRSLMNLLLLCRIFIPALYPECRPCCA